MLYDDDKYTVFDHHEQSTNGVEPVDPHTPGSQPPRMDGQSEVTDAIQDELAGGDYFHALYADYDALDGCGCGPKERENEGCGCGTSRENGGR